MGAAEQQKQDSLVALTIVLTSVSAIAVSLRMFCRWYLLRLPGLDDYSMLIAVILAIGYMVEILVGKANHIGFPMDTLSFDNMVSLLKTTLSIEVTYYAIVFFVKVSILFMYLRFGVSVLFRRLCYGTIALHAVFVVICITVTLAQCRPLHMFWDLTKTVQGSCINVTAFFYSTSGFNIITDVWILVLPFKELKGLNRNKKEMIALLCIFGVGSVACIMSIVRLHSIYTYTLAEDPFRDAIEVNVWSMIEIHVAMLCASVPALKPLFTPRQIKQLGRGRSAGYERHGEGMSGYGSRTGNSTEPEAAYGMGTMSAKQSHKGSVASAETDSARNILVEPRE